MNGTSTTVLLAGDTASRSATLRKWLGQRDCHCQFATSFVETCRMLSQREFDLVLCQYDLPDRTAFPLLDWLEGSPSSLIFARSGRGRRWLPVVEGGQRRLDRPLLRTIDLPNTLGDILDGLTPKGSIEEAKEIGRSSPRRIQELPKASRL
jgi:CheY-like chemotaxis protein